MKLIRMIWRLITFNDPWPWPLSHAVGWAFFLGLLPYQDPLDNVPAKADQFGVIFTSFILAIFVIAAVRTRLHAVANPLARTTSRAALWAAWTAWWLSRIALYAGPTVPGSGIVVTQGMVTDQFIWHALDAVPALTIPSVVGWEQPLEDYDAVTGNLLLAMRLVVLIGVVDMVRAFAKSLPTGSLLRRRNSTTSDAASASP